MRREWGLQGSLCLLQGVDSSGWATVLAVIWLHDNYKDLKCEWELLERKAVTWIHNHAGRSSILSTHLLSSLGSWASSHTGGLQV